MDERTKSNINCPQNRLSSLARAMRLFSSKFCLSRFHYSVQQHALKPMRASLRGPVSSRRNKRAYSSNMNAGDFIKRSKAHLERGQWHEAEEDASAVLNLTPLNLEALHCRAVARAKQGNSYGARKDTKTFLKRGGDFALSRLLIENIVAMERETRGGPRTTGESPSAGYALGDAYGGVGAYALQQFFKGELVLIESAIMELSSPEIDPSEFYPSEIDPSEFYPPEIDPSEIDPSEFYPSEIDPSEIISAFAKLSTTRQQQFLSLHNAHPKLSLPHSHPIWLAGIFRTNAFVGENSRVVCLNASRFNHSCSSNAVNSWDTATKTMRIFAVRDIAPGEEIVLNYNWGTLLMAYNTRREHLRMAWGFDCNCALCSLSGPAAALSDRRCTEMKSIYEYINSPVKIQPADSRDRLLKIKRLITLLEEERVVSAVDIGRWIYDAAELCILHSDYVSATYWARNALDSCAEKFGIDNANIEAIVDTLRRPKGHKLAGQGPPATFYDIRL